jgi:hypothetical protein
MQFLEIGIKNTELFLSTFGLYVSIDTRWVLYISLAILTRKTFLWARNW